MRRKIIVAKKSVCADEQLYNLRKDWLGSHSFEGEPNRMYLTKGITPLLAVMLFVTLLACRSVDTLVAQATVIPTRTPRPSFTPIPKATDTPIPTETPTPAPTATSTKRPATPRPPTPKPQPTAVPQPTVSPYEFHANPPFPCTHSGLTFLKGTVYLNKNDPNSKYVGADRIVWASDYPHPDAKIPGVVQELEEATETLSAEQRRLIFGENAGRLYSI